MDEGRYCLKRIIIDIFILYFKKIFPLIQTIRRVFGACGPPKQRLVRSAHDCETGLFFSEISPHKISMRIVEFMDRNSLFSYEVICITRQKDKVQQLPDL